MGPGRKIFPGRFTEYLPQKNSPGEAALLQQKDFPQEKALPLRKNSPVEQVPPQRADPGTGAPGSRTWIVKPVMSIRLFPKDLPAEDRRVHRSDRDSSLHSLNSENRSRQRQALQEDTQEPRELRVCPLQGTQEPEWRDVRGEQLLEEQKDRLPEKGPKSPARAQFPMLPLPLPEAAPQTKEPPRAEAAP